MECEDEWMSAIFRDGGLAWGKDWGGKNAFFSKYNFCGGSLKRFKDSVVLTDCKEFKILQKYPKNPQLDIKF